MILASTALLLALVALWSSLRRALAAASGEVEAISESAELPDRAALIDEKKSLLRAIKDLEYEHAVGKISPEDFQRLDLAYRVRAKEVLVLLEQDLAPYRSRAEDLVAHYVGVTASDAEAAIAKPTKELDDATREDDTTKKSEADHEASLRERARALRAEAERLEALARGSKDEAEPKADHEIETAPEASKEDAS
jgi:hypothetical protein